jgi:hypothetical protein
MDWTSVWHRISQEWLRFITPTGDPFKKVTGWDLAFGALLIGGILAIVMLLCGLGLLTDCR